MRPFVPPSFDTPTAAPAPAGARWSAALLAAEACVASTGAGLDLLLQALVEGAVEAMPLANGAAIELRSGEVLRLRAASGRAGGGLGSDVPVAGSFSGHCLAERRLLVCADAESDPRVDRADCVRRGIGSIIAVPVPHAGEIAAILSFWSDRANAFGEQDAQRARMLAGQIALGLAAAPPAESAGVGDGRLAAGFRQAAIGIAHLSRRGRFLMINDRFCEIAGRSRQALIGEDFRTILHPDDVAAASGLAETLLAGAIAACEIEQRFLRPDGRSLWVALHAGLVRNESGAPDFFVAAIQDIDARKLAEADSLHDPLTGLLNRRGIQQRLERELDRAANDGSALTVAVLAMDGLAEVNGGLGFAEGDRCLRRVAGLLCDQCRPADAVARISGDEFVLVLPGLDRAAAASLMQRLERALAAAAAAERWPVACRLGLASRPGDGATATSLIATAAERLEAARMEQAA